VEQVTEIWAELDISGAQTSISEEVSLIGVDQNGQIVTGISIEPSTVRLTQSIIQSGGFRTVVVRVETEGQPGAGYLLTTIQVSPPTVTISSADPQQIENLPGFVSTQPLDLSELTENVEVRLSLDLPSGVVVVGEEGQSVLVFVGITAIEGTVVMPVPVEIIGLAPGLQAQISPETVDVILSGPVAILNSLTSEDVRVFADLTEYGVVGTYLVELTVEILPDRVQLDSINPTTVEVTLTILLTPIATPTPTPTPEP
jgi:YbbR domain-containing protein